MGFSTQNFEEISHFFEPSFVAFQMQEDSIEIVSFELGQDFFCEGLLSPRIRDEVKGSFSEDSEVQLLGGVSELGTVTPGLNFYQVAWGGGIRDVVTRGEHQFVIGVDGCEAINYMGAAEILSIGEIDGNRLKFKDTD